MALVRTPWPIRSVYFDPAISASVRGRALVAEYASVHPDRTIIVARTVFAGALGCNVTPSDVPPEPSRIDLVVAASQAFADDFRERGAFAVTLAPSRSSEHDLVDDVLPVAAAVSTMPVAS